MRLSETLADKVSMVDTFGGDFQKIWDNYGQILQRRPFVTRPVKMTHSAICKKVYFFWGLNDIKSRLDGDKANSVPTKCMSKLFVYDL